MTNLLHRADLRKAAELFSEACRQSRLHSEHAQKSLAEYGGHGADISGCVRDHFPEVTKNTLRSYARNVSILSDAAYAARPKGVHISTMRKLAQQVAARDGSGFYGPQA